MGKHALEEVVGAHHVGLKIAFSDFSGFVYNLSSTNATTASLSYSSNHNDLVHSHLFIVNESLFLCCGHEIDSTKSSEEQMARLNEPPVPAESIDACWFTWNSLHAAPVRTFTDTDFLASKTKICPTESRNSKV